MSDNQFFTWRAMVWLVNKKDLVYDELVIANDQIVIRTEDKFKDLTSWFNKECLLSNGTYRY